MQKRTLFIGIGGDFYTKSVIDQLRKSGHVDFAAGVIDKSQDFSVFDTVPAHFSDALFAEYRRQKADYTGIDGRLYDSIRHCEGNILRQMDRLLYEPQAQSVIPPFTGSFDDRRRLLLRHLEFWDLVITELNITFAVFHNVPHQVFDTILYHLCKSRGILTLILSSVGVFRDTYFVSESIEELGLLQLGTELNQAAATTQIDRKSRVLGDWQRICDMVDTAGEAHVATKPYSRLRALVNNGHIGGSDVTVHSVLSALGQRVSRFLGESTIDLASTKRKKTRLKQVAAARKEELESVATGLLPKHFLYFPLHFQPEASTSARGDHYVELREVVALVAAALPSDFMLVLKEHPHQYEKLLPRADGFFRSLVSVPRVHLVDSSVPSTVLRERCRGVITVSGSNGFEVLATGKGVIAFGTASWREAPGVWTVRTKSEVHAAVNSVCGGGTISRDVYLPYLDRLKKATFLADLSDSRGGKSELEVAEMQLATSTNLVAVIRAWIDKRGAI